MAPIQVGDSLPDVTVYENTPGDKVNIKDEVKTGKNVIFAIPGAFTPTCTKTHFPSVVADYDAIKAKGVDKIYCISVNDPFVMAAFGELLKAEGKVRCLSDMFGEFTKAIGLELDLTAALGNVRSQRYVMVVQDGKVAKINVEPDSTKAECTKGSDILNLL